MPLDAGHPYKSARPTRRVPSAASLLLNPFNKLSAHHRPVGRGTSGNEADLNPLNYYGIPGTSPGTTTRGRLSIITQIEVGGGSVGVKYHHYVRGTDPSREVVFNAASDSNINLPFTQRMPDPNSAEFVYPTEPTNPADANVLLYPRNGQSVDIGDLYHEFQRVGAGSAGSPLPRANLRRPYGLLGLDYVNAADPAGWEQGSSASRLRWPGVMLRYHEMSPANPAPINHCLHVWVTRKTNSPDPLRPQWHVLGKTRVWPAQGTDSTSGNADENLGDIPYGTRCVIRYQDRGLRNSLDLTARGLVLFDCLLRYGFYVADGGSYVSGADDGGVICFRTDHGPANAPSGNTDGRWPQGLRDELVTEFGKLLPYCYPVRYQRSLATEDELHTDGLPYASGGGPLYADAPNTAWDA
jgi:hypothetical protein